MLEALHRKATQLDITQPVTPSTPHMYLLSKNQILFLVSWLALSLSAVACSTIAPQQPNEPAVPPKLILQRLSVAFLGQDGSAVIGSGCSGDDGKGTIINYHIVVGGVDENKQVHRIIVAGDNSTLTWEFPCSDNWALSASNLGNGNWEIFIAPSLSSKVYTVMFFYDDDTFALGVGVAP
ncbi:MAG TPA: hypothetical protein PKK96_16005 [Anaerolineales bacterium]|nr:hypothetical protein [Anaerolineales bacterium]HNS62502.1 hypothetical protein [Anaerolineales bacterium]